MNETAKALELIYEKMCEELEDRHSRWVDQNWAMRGMELAKSQIESKGDTYVDYAVALLDGGYDRLKGLNEKERKEMRDFESFVWWFILKTEEIAGVKLDRKKFDKATDCSKRERHLPPLPF